MAEKEVATLRFEPLEKISGLKHRFVGRIPAAGRMTTDKDEALRVLEPYHRVEVGELGRTWEQVATAEQVHGAEIAQVDRESCSRVASGVDGLITNCPDTLLGIYVADCGAVSIVDPVQRAVGLVHSGRKGSELDITGAAIRALNQAYGSDPDDLVVHLAPCIRPPDYEVDFSVMIRDSALAAGVREGRFHDCEISTSRDLSRFYSYRIEKGATGRMLALLGW